MAGRAVGAAQPSEAQQEATRKSSHHSRCRDDGSAAEEQKQRPTGKGKTAPDAEERRSALALSQ